MEHSTRKYTCVNQLGFEKGNEVLKLYKSIYGLKQAARCRNRKLHLVLVENGCVRNDIDNCLYIKKEDDFICYLLVHVEIYLLLQMMNQDVTN